MAHTHTASQVAATVTVAVVAATTIILRSNAWYNSPNTEYDAREKRGFG